LIYLKQITLILLLLCSYLVNAQKIPSDYLAEASKFYENNDTVNALKAYQYIVDHYPGDELYTAALYKTGTIYYAQHKFDKAIPAFQTILERNFKTEKIDGEDVIGETRTNFQHYASSILCDIYYNMENYDLALHYLTLSDTVFYYIDFCGNAQAENAMNNAIRYADIYNRLHCPDDAIMKLLPMVFNMFADNTAVIERLKVLLKDNIALKVALDRSIENMYRRDVTVEGTSYYQYYFTLLGTELVVPDSVGEGDQPFDKQRTIERFKRTPFYKMVQEL